MGQISNRIILLRDYDGEIDPQIVIFEYPVVFEQIEQDFQELRKKEGGWSFYDLLEILDRYGKYEIYNINDFLTIDY